jgi:hypothetical protein
MQMGTLNLLWWHIVTVAEMKQNSICVANYKYVTSVNHYVYVWKLSQ